jgi:hypothetical protein
MKRVVVAHLVSRRIVAPVSYPADLILIGDRGPYHHAQAASRWSLLAP